MTQLLLTRDNAGQWSPLLIVCGVGLGFFFRAPVFLQRCFGCQVILHALSLLVLLSKAFCSQPFPGSGWLGKYLKTFHWGSQCDGSCCGYWGFKSSANQFRADQVQCSSMTYCSTASSCNQCWYITTKFFSSCNSTECYGTNCFIVMFSNYQCWCTSVWDQESQRVSLHLERIHIFWTC